MLTIGGAVLCVYEGARKGQRMLIQEKETLLGHGTGYDVVLPEKQVSRKHIKIRCVDDIYYDEDLGSKNGTWINDHKLTGEVRLNDGDEIDLAKAVILMFYEENDACRPSQPL